MFLNAFGDHPKLGKYLKQEGLPALRALAKTMMIPAADIVKSNDEVAQDEAKAAKADPLPNPEVMKIEAQMNITRLEWDGKLKLADMERETALIVLAGQQNMKLDELRATLEDSRANRESKAGEGKADRDSKERIVATEAAVTERVGKGGGGYF